MFYVKATLKVPTRGGIFTVGSNLQREAYVCYAGWGIPAFQSKPPKPLTLDEATKLLARCEEVHGSLYDHNLRIVSA
jgi:hypothetical protein